MITIDTSRKLGPIKPVHGVNNGPTSFGGLTDLSRSYKAAGFPYARMHDPEYPPPTAVDIPQIFPDFSADETDPANYVFENTDAALKAIVDCGTQIIYRLGTSIEHTVRKLYTDVPADMDKWARICIQIIRHYNEGWANGFHWNIRHWEIWNEPDLNQDDMWKGTPEDYFRLYVISSKAIKAAFPHLLIGGPALAYKMDFCRSFLEHIRRENAPLDFFSWHMYNNRIADFAARAADIRALLDANGYAHSITVCDEWNRGEFRLSNASPEEEEAKVRYFGDMTRLPGQAHAAATMITFQKSCCDIATYYDSHPTNLWCGIFDRYGVPTVTYQSFVCFNALYRLGGCEVYTHAASPDTYVVAAEKDGTLRLLISHYNGTAVEEELYINGKLHATLSFAENGIHYEEIHLG